MNRPFKTLDEYAQSKELAPEKLTSFAKEMRLKGKTIVTTNGSFDLLHDGHNHLLFEASKLGDIFIALLNTDRSIQQYKSTKRPIVPLKNRLRMMAMNSLVDFVTWFDEVDPRIVLSHLKPDVHVIGAEYRGKAVEQAEIESWGGKVHFVEKVPGLSTSLIIKKICDSVAG